MELMEEPEGLAELRLMSERQNTGLHFLFQSATLHHTLSTSPHRLSSSLLRLLDILASFTFVLFLLPLSPAFTSSLTLIPPFSSSFPLIFHSFLFQWLPFLHPSPFHFLLLSFLLSSLFFPPSQTFPQPVSLHHFVLVSLLIFKHVKRIHHTFTGSVSNPK